MTKITIISEPCRAGSYSETGYDVDGCTECPDGFYQPAEGMASCLECSSNEITDGTPKTEETDCIALDSKPCFLLACIFKKKHVKSQ